jgi:hypothetical protein
LELFKNMVGGEEVFGGDAEGFEEGDLGGVFAAFFGTGEEFSELCLGVGLGQEAFFFWDEEFPCFVE